MKAKYADGGKTKKVRSGASAEYKAKGEALKKKQEEKAQSLRAQRAYNSAQRAEAMGESARAQRIREAATTRGIPVSSAQSGMMGSSATGANTEAQLRARKPGVSQGVFVPGKPAATVSGADRAAAIGKGVGLYTMEDAKKRGIKLKYGGKMKK